MPNDSTWTCGRIVGRWFWLLLVAGCGPGDARVRDFHPPATPPAMLAGELQYVGACARCHGSNAVGTDSGPALIATVYRVPHHADAAFELAVRTGVRAHHWRFGDMPPQPQVSDDAVRQITQYIRWLQKTRSEVRGQRSE